jgi:iron(III) transport system substrate-binding protein
VATGNPPVAINAPWSVARRHLRANKDLRLLAPKQGVPARFSASGLLFKAPRPNAGKVFLDFLLSAEGQRLLGPGLRDAYSPRRDVPGPEGLPALASITLLRPASWEDYARTGRDFPAAWERTFGSLR